MATLHVVDVVMLAFWLIAAGISLYFSLGSARIWTSISTGFFLIFVSEAYLVAPWAKEPRLVALHAIIGTVAIMVMTHGFQEYYVFSRTLEVGGRRRWVYIVTLAVIVASGLFLLVNPAPSPAVLRQIRIIENGNWVFLSLINLDMIRKIIVQVRGTPMARGFVAFVVVFTAIFIWRGAELYLQVYGWDADFSAVVVSLGGVPRQVALTRIAFSRVVHDVAGVVASVSVGGTFVYLYRLMR